MKLKVVGLDPSLRNWGIAEGTYDTDTAVVEISNVETIQPSLPTGKQVRQNSLDVDSARQLFIGALAACKDANAIFIEVPIGSQSARAMASYGICVGVVGSLIAQGLPVYQVTPTEVKLAGAGTKTATKKEMIDWAVAKHPNAGWPVYNRGGKGVISEAKAEHQADALAAIYAGIASPSFNQMIKLINP